MRTTAGALALVTAFSALTSPAAAGHLVAPATVDRALEQKAAERARDTARVDTLLASHAAAAAASELGVKIEAVRTAAARLSDAERADLLARAEALSVDPAGGYLDPDIKQLLVILLIVLIVVVLLDAID
jgi:predicted phage gp36 major capsid-like protein